VTKVRILSTYSHILIYSGLEPASQPGSPRV